MRKNSVNINSHVFFIKKKSFCFSMFFAALFVWSSDSLGSEKLSNFGISIFDFTLASEKTEAGFCFNCEPKEANNNTFDSLFKLAEKLKKRSQLNITFLKTDSCKKKPQKFFEPQNNYQGIFERSEPLSYGKLLKDTEQNYGIFLNFCLNW